MSRYRCPLCNEAGHSSMTCPIVTDRPLGDGIHWTRNGQVERCGRIFCITCGPPAERDS